MHELLELKGKLESKKRNGSFGPSKLPKGSSVNVDKVKILLDEITKIKEFWSNIDLINKTLVNVKYNKIVAKSNRIKRLFTINSSDNPNNFIVGAKFNDNKHVITYSLERNYYDVIINNLKLLIEILIKEFNGIIDDETLNKVNFNNYNMSKSLFKSLIVDIYYIEKFMIPTSKDREVIGNVIVTFYDLKDETIKALENIGVKNLILNKIDNTTYLLSREDYIKVKNNIPYLIAIELDDLSNYISNSLGNIDYNDFLNFPKPKNEPTIGVIDTLFDDNVYFKDWVTKNNSFLNPDIIDENDYFHATEVCSLIVSGHLINDKLDDGCGMFKVRHFGIAKNGKVSSFDIMKNIEHIVETNPDIIVWNLSLGSEREVDENFISFEGAKLDELQNKYNVIFVVSGTNKNSNHNCNRIGAPADSINSLVVNSATLKGDAASYSRRGPVLSFFNKPDICAFGGDFYEPLRVCNAYGETYKFGTSFAAPWISRKLAYLIHKLGMPREIAKALIIDSATSWEKTPADPTTMGFGVVPLHIKDIISTNKDEIKFYIYGVADKFDTYTYNIPVPIVKKTQPFVAKATLCYFPSCSRNQGVDYTDVELDLHFGRIVNTSKGIEIKTINDNKQVIPDIFGGYEQEARKEYRKWDNVKHICEKYTYNKRPKAVYDNGLWGLSIKKVIRLEQNNNDKVPFGVVITLKDIYGNDHYEEFIQQCNFRGWLVNRINVEEKLTIYEKIEEDIILE